MKRGEKRPGSVSYSPHAFPRPVCLALHARFVLRSLEHREKIVPVLHATFSQSKQATTYMVDNTICFFCIHFVWWTIYWNIFADEKEWRNGLVIWLSRLNFYRYSLRPIEAKCSTEFAQGWMHWLTLILLIQNGCVRRCYSRTPATRTLKGNKIQFKLAGFELSGLTEHSICHLNNW